MLFAHLDGTEQPIPLAPFAWPRHGLHILDDHRCEWQNLLEVYHDTRFGFPTASS